MYSSLDQYSHSLTIDINPQWQGSRSQKFKKGKMILPAKNLIKNSVIDMPDQTIFTGRQHFVNESSPQYKFKRPKKKIQWDQYWHPRPSQIKTFDFKPSSPLPRPQRLHLRQIHNPLHRFESIQTDFQSKYIPTRQYSVQQKMQKKVRIDQLELRRSFYKNLNIFK